MTNPNTTLWQQCHFSQQLCNTLCSTASVTDHDKPAVKSIVILRIPNYSVLTYKNIPINVTKEYPETLKFGLNPIMKSYSTHFKCHVIFANECMKNKNLYH